MGLDPGFRQISDAERDWEADWRVSINFCGMEKREKTDLVFGASVSHTDEAASCRHQRGMMRKITNNLFKSDLICRDKKDGSRLLSFILMKGVV